MTERREPTPGDLPGFVVMNPSAVGNLDETPQVFMGDALGDLMGLCRGDGTEAGWCGALINNGAHHKPWCVNTPASPSSDGAR